MYHYNYRLLHCVMLAGFSLIFACVCCFSRKAFASKVQSVQRVQSGQSVDEISRLSYALTLGVLVAPPNGQETDNCNPNPKGNTNNSWFVCFFVFFFSVLYSAACVVIFPTVIYQFKEGKHTCGIHGIKTDNQQGKVFSFFFGTPHRYTV